MTKPALVLFTSGFPYDGIESVLGAEVEVLAQEFPRVFIVPSRLGASRAPVPPGVSVVDLGWSHDLNRASKLRALRSRRAANVIERMMRDRTNWRPYARGARAYLDILAENLLKAATLERWIAENRLHDGLFYDYWFENSTLALAALRKEGVIKCAISRAHGFDVFDFRWNNLGRVPFREFKADHLDAIFTVSEDGGRYLRQAVGRNSSKVRTAHLGVPLPPTYPTTRPTPALVVSCSSLVPVKRVHLIPEVLRNCSGLLHWIHFGDGPEQERVRAAATRLPSRVTCEFRGSVDNSQVRQFYATQPVSVFLSVSESEGVPVSMMEAQSFGIPIVALAVGGVPEVVTTETGILQRSDATVADVAEALMQAIQPGRFNADRIRAVFTGGFEAISNYRAFAASALIVWRGV